MFWKRNFPKKQLQEFFKWASGIVNENDVILVDLSGLRGFFSFSFPLRYGDNPKEISNSNRKETFIICTPRHKGVMLDDEWIQIFNSPKLEILESRMRIAGVTPLRWGLDDGEKRTLVSIAREALRKFLTNKERFSRDYFNAFPLRFRLRTDLDVALWVDGYLRGSAVVENYHLVEGVAAAAIFASRDARFKPLAIEELPRTRIEITLMSDLRLPLSEEELRHNVIYPEKGYLLQRKDQKGWFLPEVFNVRRFQNLKDFLEVLAEEKAGFAPTFLKDSDVRIFEVDDFIEAERMAQPLMLFASTKKINKNFDFQSTKAMLRNAAEWLLNIQEKDGNFPPIINPLTNRQTQVNWPRLAFTAWSLVEFSKATGERKYALAADKSFNYINKYLQGGDEVRISDVELVAAYFGQLALNLGRIKEAFMAGELILRRIDNLFFNPLTMAQIAGFFKVLANNDQKFHAPLRKLAEILKIKFEEGLKTNKPMNLAVWAELVNIFNGIDKIFSEKVVDWLKSQQLQNGAFPESTISDFVYTRGTGKIFEVLALDYGKNREVINKVLKWLGSMQYDNQNSFFIPEELHFKVLGGFRHDYLNPEVWIDAAGHVLLGGSRLLINSEK